MSKKNLTEVERSMRNIAHGQYLSELERMAFELFKEFCLKEGTYLPSGPDVDYLAQQAIHHALVFRREFEDIRKDDTWRSPDDL